MGRLRAAIAALPAAQPVAPRRAVPSQAAKNLHTLQMLLECYGPTPYPIVSTHLMADDGAHDLCAVATISPSEALLNYCYNHPDHAHIPRCVRGSTCLGAAVKCAGTNVEYGKPLPSFRTARTFGLTKLPAYLCIMCLTERQVGAGLDQHAQTQIYSLAMTRRSIPASRLIEGPGGIYRALHLDSCSVVQCVVGGHILFVVDVTQGDTF